MDNQRNSTNRSTRLNEELADVLTAISVVAKALATDIRRKMKEVTNDGSKVGNR